MVSIIGKTLILFGILLVIFGAILTFLPKIPILGKLPGDIYLKKDNFVFIAPLGTSLLLSIILSLIFYFLSKIFR